jgi:hypothetical protein
MSNTPQLYTTVAANIEHDREKILALWNRGLTHGGMPEAKFDWYYRKNCGGPPQIFFLCHGPQQETVGVAAVGRREMRIGTQTIMSGELVDFVAVPEHRTLFPALFLQKEIRRLTLKTPLKSQNSEMPSDGAHDILYGLPNPKSLAVVKRAGYQLVGQLVRRARILRLAGYLSRHAPVWIGRLIGPMLDSVRMGVLALRAITTRGLRSCWLDRPDSRFDDLWKRVAAQSRMNNVLMGVRDSAFLTWRFIDCPLRTYRFFALFTNTEDRLIAYAVCAVDGEALHVHDFLVDPTAPDADKTLWIALSREAYRRGHSTLSVEFLGAESIQQSLEAIGLVKRQQRPLYATTAAAIHDRNTLLQESNWYLTSADEDG